MGFGNSIKQRANSYSQYGEDSIISLMKDLYGLKKLSYMDIGAHHPFKLNNTQVLYENGERGVNIEPDPIQYNLFKKYRKHDINLNMGVHEKPGILTFYQFDHPEFNTFSAQAAAEISRKGIKKVAELTVPVDTFNNIVEKHLGGVAPDFVSLDAEGVDEVIIASIDYNRFAPKIICVETYAYGVGVRNQLLIEEIIKKGYRVHADTFVNTLFIHDQFTLIRG